MVVAWNGAIRCFVVRCYARPVDWSFGGGDSLVNATCKFLPDARSSRRTDWSGLVLRIGARLLFHYERRSFHVEKRTARPRPPFPFWSRDFFPNQRFALLDAVMMGSCRLL